MRVSCKAMPDMDRAVIVGVVRGRWRRALRCCAVSAVNVVVGLSALAFFLEALDFAPVLANLTAWMVSTGPACLLGCCWVWQQLGANSVTSEILPFWVIAFVGLAVSSVTIAVLGGVTGITPVLMLGTVVAYSVVWVAKYLVLDGLLWPKAGDEPVVEVL